MRRSGARCALEPRLAKESIDGFSVGVRSGCANAGERQMREPMRNGRSHAAHLLLLFGAEFLQLFGQCTFGFGGSDALEVVAQLGELAADGARGGRNRANAST